MRFPVPTGSAAIAQYLVDRATVHSPTTLEHRLAALSFIHRVLGSDNPTQDARLKAVLRGIKRDRIDGGWQKDQAPALELSQLAAVVQAIGERLPDLRDKALILVGLLGAFRQSELTALDCGQLEWVETRGVVVRMGRVKQDQEAARPRYKAIPQGAERLCAVTALRAWLNATGIEAGPVFRAVDRHGNLGSDPISHTSANRIVKKWVGRAGIANPEAYSGHSLRASFITIARELRIPDHLIALQSHHRDLRTIDVYYRPVMAFEKNPALELVQVLVRLGDQVGREGQ